MWNNINNSSHKIISKIQCKVCTGSGFIKTTSVLCNNCHGNKCGKCMMKGFKIPPWSLCENCHGDGEFVKYEKYETKN